MNRAILVKSCQKNGYRSGAITATWFQGIRGHVPVFIASGGYSGEVFCVDKGLPNRLLLQCGDDYSDNSIKVRDAIDAIMANYPVTHLFICDDDTFIHPERWLAHEPTGEFECRLYHPRDPMDIHRNDSQPWANGGAGWYMSRRLCELYAQEVTARCSWDDILATQVAQRHGVEIVDRPDLYSDVRYSDGPMMLGDNDVITCHPVEPDEMVKIWEGSFASV